MQRPLIEEPEQPPPDGEHDPADPEEPEDPGKPGGGRNGDTPEVAPWGILAWLAAGALLTLAACGQPAQQLTPYACSVTKASPRPAECATVSPAAPSPSATAAHELIEESPATPAAAIPAVIPPKPAQIRTQPPAGPLPAASSARINPTPWIPPLLICPKPVNGTNGEWISLTSPAICEPEHVYAFVAPPGWKPGDPVPAFKPAP